MYVFPKENLTLLMAMVSYMRSTIQHVLMHVYQEERKNILLVTYVWYEKPQHLARTIYHKNGKNIKSPWFIKDPCVVTLHESVRGAPE